MLKKIKLPILSRYPMKNNQPSLHLANKSAELRSWKQPAYLAWSMQRHF